MAQQEVPAVGDVVTIPGEHAVDGVTRVGIVAKVADGLRGGHVLTLRTPVAGILWAEHWHPDMMIVARVGSTEQAPPADCGHEVTGGYVYTGDPAGSRSMEVHLGRIQAVDAGGMWVTVLDAEGMECELTVTGLSREALLRWLLDL